MGSLVFCTQHKGICYCTNMSDSFKTILGYLETHLSAIHPSSNKQIMATIGNMYLTTTLFLKGVRVVLFFCHSDLHLLWCKHKCMFLIS
jgi:hypothetical protein